MYVMAFGACCACNRVFGFNPHHVPSILVEGKREPVCKTCVEFANPKRKAAGLQEFDVHPDAYEPCDENEL